MDYNFSGLCADQIEKLEKRLDNLKKACIKEYVVALNVINNKSVNERRSDIKTQIDDLFNDTKNKTSGHYTKCMNEVQRILTSSLNE
jgi:hypothetical protein